MTQDTRQDRRIVIFVDSTGAELEFRILANIIYQNQRYLLLVDPADNEARIQDSLVWRLTAEPSEIARELLVTVDVHEVHSDIKSDIVRYEAGKHYGDQTNMSLADKFEWIGDEALYHGDLPEN